MKGLIKEYSLTKEESDRISPLDFSIALPLYFLSIHSNLIYRYGKINITKDSIKIRFDDDDNPYLIFFGNEIYLR